MAGAATFDVDFVATPFPMSDMYLPTLDKMSSMAANFRNSVFVNKRFEFLTKGFQLKCMLCGRNSTFKGCSLRASNF